MLTILVRKLYFKIRNLRYFFANIPEFGYMHQYLCVKNINYHVDNCYLSRKIENIPCINSSCSDIIFASTSYFL